MIIVSVKGIAHAIDDQCKVSGPFALSLCGAGIDKTNNNGTYRDGERPITCKRCLIILDRIKEAQA